MKLEVGMYVRTTNGIIKVAKIENDVIKDEKGYMHYGDFIKASHNLLGNDEEPCLIEVGDYVNGKEIKEISVRDNKPIVKFASIPGCYYMNDEIDTIVTKEMFESMSYKVGD